MKKEKLKKINKKKTTERIKLIQLTWDDWPPLHLSNPSRITFFVF